MIVGLIVKDEAASIADTVASLKRTLPDPRIVVFDTGSTDGTVAEAERAGAEASVLQWASSGRYDESYNFLLYALEVMAEPNEWVFHAYARRVYEGRWSPPDAAQLVSSTEHWSETCDATRIVAYRARLKCRYAGATHEVLTRPAGIPIGDSGVRLRRHPCEHPRPHRFERDLALLEHETDPRSRFYYAQTLACLGGEAMRSGDEAKASEFFQRAYVAYLARADMKGLAGDDNEAAVALTRAIQMMPRAPQMLRVATRMCHGALEIDPDRGEPWLALAQFCRDVGRTDLIKRYAAMACAAEPDPRALFVDPTVRDRALALAR